MARKTGFIGFGAGLLVGATATIALTGRHALPRAMAQAPPAPVVQAVEAPLAAAAPRYQISAVGSVSAPGALIIDTKTGVIWRYINEGTPLRQVAKVPTEP